MQHRDPRALFGGRPVIAFDSEIDRRRFLTGATIIGVGSTLAFWRAGDPAALADGGTGATGGTAGDIEILNFALTLEYLEADFYARGIADGILSGRDLELVDPIAQHEATHVTAISDTIVQLGGTPVAKPSFTIPEDVFSGRDPFLEQASSFEELGITAYHGQITAISSKEVLAAAASIAGVESRHAAVLADLIGGDPFPAVVEATRTMEEVLAVAQPFLEGK